jgi:hypothetical protein
MIAAPTIRSCFKPLKRSLKVSLGPGQSRAENSGPRWMPRRRSITATASFLRTANRVLSSRATDRQRNAEPLPLRTSDRPSNRDHLQRRARKLQCPRTRYSTLGQCQTERSRLAANICKRFLPPCGLSSRFLAVNEARRQAQLHHSSKIWCFSWHSSTSRALPPCGQRGRPGLPLPTLPTIQGPNEGRQPGQDKEAARQPTDGHVGDRAGGWRGE